MDKFSAYNPDMGRPLEQKRHAQGARLAELRKLAGLSQGALAELIGEPQSSIARWELSAKPPPSDALPKLAKVLGVAIEDILNVAVPAKKRGPAGKAEILFQQVSKLPRRQQEQVLQMVSLFLEAQRGI